MSLIRRIITSLSKILGGKSSSRRSARKKSKKISAGKRRPLKKAAKARSKLKSRPKPRPKPKPKPAFKPKPKPKPKSVPAVKETEVADITHFFSKISVCVLKMRGDVKVGDKIHVKGGGTDFIQAVKSIQIESVDVKSARRGQLVGIKVERPAKPGDKVYRIG